MDLYNNVVDAIFLNKEIQLWVAVFFTLMMLSFLYRDNPLYKLGENIFLGISIGYGWVRMYNITIKPFLIRPVQDMFIDFQAYDITTFFWLLMGSTLLFRFSRKYGWVANYYMAFMYAYVAGITIPLNVQNMFVYASNLMQPIFEQPSLFEITKWAIIIFGTFAALMYFFFSKPHQGALGKAAKFGILVLMVNFGAAFGSTVMGRVALFVGRAQVLADNWEKSIVSAIIIIAILFVYFKFIHKEKEFDDASFT